MNRAVFVSLTILCLLCVSSMTGLIQTVKADGGTNYIGTNYINADGSMTLSAAVIRTADNITYTLTDNITTNVDSIVIYRSNMVLNGAGCTVMGGAIGWGITLRKVVNVTVNNITLKNFTNGIVLLSSSDSTLSGNNITANGNYGIWLDSSSNNTLSGNNITANSIYGILLDSSFNTIRAGLFLNSSSDNNNLSGNNIANNSEGVFLNSTSDNNTLSGNNIVNNDVGINFDSTSGNALSGNNVTNNGDGIVLSGSSNNFIFHNDFVNNTNQVYADGLSNIWDNGYPSGGNYWSDYLTKYPNATPDFIFGFWNTPYVIDANNTDHYPLAVPIGAIPEFPSFLILPLFMIATLLPVIIYKKKGAKSTH